MSTPQPPTQAAQQGLAAGCGWPFRALTGGLVRAPAVVLGATQCGVCCFCRSLNVSLPGDRWNVRYASRVVFP